MPGTASADDLSAERLYRATLDHPLLTKDAERLLVQRAATGDSSAIDSLVRHNQRLVAQIARRYWACGMGGNLDLMDLVQYGNVGLLIAIRRFDPSRQLRFSTYATWWIRSLVRRGALTHGDTASRTAREGDLIYVIRKTITQLDARLRRRPTPQEIAEASGISLKLLSELLPMLQQTISADTDRESGALIERIRSNDDTASTAEESMDSEALLAALDTLPDRYAQVIRLRFCMDGAPEQLSYSEIGRRLGGISHTAVQKIEQRALEMLREALS